MLFRSLGRVITERHTDTGTEMTIALSAGDRDRLVRQYGPEILKK